LPGFSQLKIVRFAAKSHGRREKSLGKCGLDKEMRPFSGQAAPSLRHAAVDSLHSIDFTADKRVGFLLTLKMKGVKTNSFFDSF